MSVSETETTSSGSGSSFLFSPPVLSIATPDHIQVFMEFDRSFRDQFEVSGRLWLRNAISDADLSLFGDAMADQTRAGQRLDLSGSLDRALSEQSSLLKAIHSLNPYAQPVRIVAFEKSEGVNWGVPWHQDRVIAVTEKADVDGYRNWTNKSGIWHCEPPQSVLDQMLFVRVHLDESDQENGAMEIAVGSHSSGIIPSDNAEREAEQFPHEICCAKRGDVLVLNMLTLHRSKPAQTRSGRRVLRIDFSSAQLPSPLSWTSVTSKRRSLS